MYSSNDERILLGEKYISELNWVLVPVVGTGHAAESAVGQGMARLEPTTEALAEILLKSPAAGIGIHLGGSGLIDLEGDSPEAEALLDDLCWRLEFPSWRSRRSKHRLFQANPASRALGHQGVGD